MINQVEKEAKLAKVAPVKVMEQIAEMSGATLKYMLGQPKALRKAAIEATRLGITLDDMAGVADSLLDIETSIENQMIAMVLTGKKLNFSRARGLALNNDILGATQAVIDEVGSLNKFENMNRYQREAIANAAGMELETLMKTLKAEKERGKMSIAELKKQKQAAKIHETVQSTLTQISNKFKAIGARLGAILLPYVTKILNAIGG